MLGIFSEASLDLPLPFSSIFLYRSSDFAGIICKN